MQLIVISKHLVELSRGCRHVMLERASSLADLACHLEAVGDRLRTTSIIGAVTGVGRF